MLKFLSLAGQEFISDPTLGQYVTVRTGAGEGEDAFANVLLGDFRTFMTTVVNDRVDDLAEELANYSGPSIWPAARTMSLSGPITGSASFDGSQNFTLLTSIADAALSIAKTSGLQAALDGKLGATAVASSATKLQTARTIALTGVVAGSGVFDGTANLSIATTLADGSLSIAKTSGLQTALDGKAVLAAANTFAGNNTFASGRLTIKSTTPSFTPSLFINDSDDSTLGAMIYDRAAKALSLRSFTDGTMNGVLTLSGSSLAYNGNTVYHSGNLDAAALSYLSAAVTEFATGAGVNCNSFAAGTKNLVHTTNANTPGATAGSYWYIETVLVGTATNVLLQRAYSNGADEQYVRRGSGGVWSAWRRQWNSSNFDPTGKLDSNAVAASAAKLATARTIALTGIATGTGTFDGSANLSIATSIADGALAVAKTSGLQAALDNKVNIGQFGVGGSAANYNWAAEIRQSQFTAGPTGSPETGKNYFGIHSVFTHADYYAMNLVARDNRIWFQTVEAGTVQPWRELYHSGNFTPADYTPITRSVLAGNGIIGGGALSADVTLTLGTPGTISGTSTNSVSAGSHTHALSANLKAWDGVTVASKLDATATAVAATKLATARTVALTGPVTATGTFDGTANLSLATAVADGAFSIAKISGLQAALDLLAPKANPTFTGTARLFGDLLPDVDNVRSLGAPNLMWKDVYIGPGSLYINGQKVLEDNSGTIRMLADPNQNIAIQTSGSGDIELAPTGTGVIQMKGTVSFLGGSKIRSSNGSALLFDEDIQFSVGTGLIGTPTVNGNPILHSGNLDLSSTFLKGAANAADLRLTSGDGRGIRFWDNINYSIFMSVATNSTYGGRVAGDTTSDYNMYFRMASGTNRGFVFESSQAGKIFSINPDGVRSNAAVTAPQFNGIHSVANPASPNDTMTFGWNANTGRIRLGGTGSTPDAPFLIQGVGDFTRLRLDSNGNATFGGAAMTAGGNTVWHGGNFTPASKLDTAGGTMGGVIQFSGGSALRFNSATPTYFQGLEGAGDNVMGFTRTAKNNYAVNVFGGLSVSGQSVWHTGNLVTSNFGQLAQANTWTQKQTFNGEGMSGLWNFRGATAAGNASTVGKWARLLTATRAYTTSNSDYASRITLVGSEGAPNDTVIEFDLKLRGSVASGGVFVVSSPSYDVADSIKLVIVDDGLASGTSGNIIMEVWFKSPTNYLSWRVFEGHSYQRGQGWTLTWENNQAWNTTYTVGRDLVTTGPSYGGVSTLPSSLLTQANTWGARQIFNEGWGVANNKANSIGAGGGSIRGTDTGSVVLSSGTGGNGYIYFRPNGDQVTTGQVVVYANGVMDLSSIRTNNAGAGAVMLEMAGDRAWQFRQFGTGATSGLELFDVTGGKAFHITSTSSSNRVTIDPNASRVLATEFAGNATSATKLATARTINGVSFDGTANINITAAMPSTISVAGAISAGAGLRSAGWGGTTTNGVVYFGTADSYIYKSGGNFSFKNEQGGYTANLTSGGNIWTSGNLTPLDRNTGGSIMSTIDVYSGAFATQTGLYGMGYNNGIRRWLHVMEADASYAVYSYNTSGANPTRVAKFNNVASGQTLFEAFTVYGGIKSVGAAATIALSDRGTGSDWNIYANADIMRFWWAGNPVGDKFAFNKDGQLSASRARLSAEAPLHFTFGDGGLSRIYAWGTGGAGDDMFNVLRNGASNYNLFWNGNMEASNTLRVGNQLYLNAGWFRTQQSGCGWYHETHGGGIFMQDNQWVRTYNNKGFLIASPGGNDGGLRMESSAPTIIFYDTDTGRTNWLHCNDDNIGFLGSNSFSWATYRDGSNNWISVGNIAGYASDERLKDGIVNVDRAIPTDFFDRFVVREFDWDYEAIAELNPNFNPIAPHEVGAIAQEVEKVYPFMVTTHEHTGIKTLMWDKAVPLLISEVQELRKLKPVVDELLARLAVLEATVGGA